MYSIAIDEGDVYAGGDFGMREAVRAAVRPEMFRDESAEQITRFKAREITGPEVYRDLPDVPYAI